MSNKESRRCIGIHPQFQVAIQYHARESFVPIGTVWGRIKIEESYESGQNMDMKNIEQREGERANMGEKGERERRISLKVFRFPQYVLLSDVISE